MARRGEGFGNRREDAEVDVGRGGNRGGVDLGKIVNAATAEGIRAIVDKHPRFKGKEGYLLGYIDREKIHEYAESVGEELQGYKDGDSAKRFLEKFYKGLAGHVASGELLNEQGKEAVLRYSWEKKAKGWGARAKEAKEILDGERYLEKAMASFRDLYELMKTGDYAQMVPELAESLYTLKRLDFLDATFNSLYENGLMDEKRYKFLKKTIRERAKTTVKSIPEQAESYATGQKEERAESYVPQRAAAVIFAVLGVATALFAHRITGNVVGISGANLLGILAGVFFLAAGALLGIKKKRDK